MKNLLFFISLIGIFYSGCSSQSGKFFNEASDCDKTKQSCMKKCREQGKSQNVCTNECEKLRTMCNAIKTKGCMQDCNLKYGKNTPTAENCKKSCNAQ